MGCRELEKSVWMKGHGGMLMMIFILSISEDWSDMNLENSSALAFLASDMNIFELFWGALFRVFRKRVSIIFCRSFFLFFGGLVGWEDRLMSSFENASAHF